MKRMIIAGAMFFILISSAVQAHNTREGWVSNTAGERLRVASLLQKPTVLIYEDHGSENQNAAFKEELSRWSKKMKLADSIQVLAIANLQKYDWFPAKQFAYSGIRSAEKEAGIPIYIDWEGSLTKEPWSLPLKSSNVLVIHPDGNVLFQRSGTLTEQDRAEALAAIQQVVGAYGNPTPAPKNP